MNLAAKEERLARRPADEVRERGGSPYSADMWALLKGYADKLLGRTTGDGHLGTQGRLV